MKKMSDGIAKLVQGEDFRGLLTDEEAIELLGLSNRKKPRRALRYLVREHGLPYVNLGRGNRRYRRTELYAFIDDRRVN